MNLSRYDNSSFIVGASLFTQIAWYLVSWTIVSGSLPGSNWRAVLLRAFGAKVGSGCVIKPNVKVKYPWNLEIGDHSWIGEGAWIDNLAEVKIGSNVCVSQGCYICTGSHDWTSASFDLVVSPVTVEDHAWLCAMSSVSPGVTVGTGAVLGFAGSAVDSLLPWSVYSGVPAVRRYARKHGLADS
ncbi:MAG: WcaF family extracellular polysaccharide biosynthesis acetyltransferase [Pseudomonadota bacterium]